MDSLIHRFLQDMKESYGGKPIVSITLADEVFDEYAWRASMPTRDTRRAVDYLPPMNMLFVYAGEAITIHREHPRKIPDAVVVPPSSLSSVRHDEPSRRKFCEFL